MSAIHLLQVRHAGLEHQPRGFKSAGPLVRRVDCPRARQPPWRVHEARTPYPVTGAGRVKPGADERGAETAAIEAVPSIITNGHH